MPIQPMLLLTAHANSNANANAKVKSIPQHACVSFSHHKSSLFQLGFVIYLCACVCVDMIGPDLRGQGNGTDGRLTEEEKADVRVRF